MRRAVVLVSLLLASTSVFDARAQTLGERVEGHVDQGLEKKPPPPRKKKKRPRKAERREPSRRPAPSPPGTATPPAKPATPSPDDALPHRVLGGEVQIDPTVSLAYRGWRPQDYPSLTVNTENAATFAVGARLKLFRILTISRAHYESNGLSSPRRRGTSIAQDAGKAAPAAAWLMGAVGVPVKFVLEPIIRYEARAFESRVTPDRPVILVPRSARENDDLSTLPRVSSPLRMSSAVETLVVGLRYHHGNDPSGVIRTGGGSLPPIYFGLGLAQFSKPYMVSVGDFVLDDLVFDARLRGAGLAFGLETPQKPARLFAELSGQVGLGEVKLTDSFSLNEALPEDWWIGYAIGEATVGYLHPLLRTKPTLLGGISGSVGGASFFYFKAFASEEESQTPAANWDLLWGLRVFLTLPL